MNEETLKNLSREEAINYLDNQMDYTYQLQKRIDNAIKYINDRMIVEQSFCLDMKQCYELTEILKDSDIDE